MTQQVTYVVTGAFSYSGSYISQRLLQRGVKIRTLTGHPRPQHPLAGSIDVRGFEFDDPDAMARNLAGADVLINTYWVRISRGENTHQRAVANTLKLFEAAQRAGVRKVVHTSIANPSLDSPLAYYAGKARLEKALIESGLQYAILRPTILFGAEDVLINNIAWMMRKLPVLGIPGDGRYRIQPIYVKDFAELAVRHAESDENVALDAVGPETFAYLDLLKTIRNALGLKTPLFHLPPTLVWLAAQPLGWMMRDVLLTRDEVRGLTADLLASDQPPTGTTSLSGWIEEHKETLGRDYASDMRKHSR